MDRIISMWPTIRAICCYTVSSVVVFQLIQFVMVRCESFSRNVRANIERFNQLQADQYTRRINDAVQQAKCSQCTRSLGSDSPTIQQAPDNPTGTTSSIQPPTVNASPKPADVRNKLSVRRMISITQSSDEQENDVPKNVVGQIARTKNLVSRLTKKFENNGPTERPSNISRNTPDRRVTLPTNDWLPKKYFVYEKTDVYEVHQETPEKSLLPPIVVTKRSQSVGELTNDPPPVTPDIIRRPQRELSSPLKQHSQRNSMDNILENDELASSSDTDEVQVRERSHSFSEIDRHETVRTVEDILKQERFSKCFSEYSISDLLNDIPINELNDTEEDAQLTAFLSRI